MRSSTLVKSAKSATMRSRYITSQTLSPSAFSATHLIPEDEQSLISTPPSSISSSPSATMSRPPPLSILPLSSLLRGIAINSVSSSPLLLPPSLRIMSVLAHSDSPLLNPDRNILLKWFMKKTFYAHFCAGENAQEVQRTIHSLKDMGFKGVMLCYAKEVVLDDKATKELEASGGAGSEASVQNEILPWKQGTLETVALAEPGDFVAVKFTGAGSQALYRLSRNLAPSPALAEAITSICDLAASRGVRLVFDAEQASLQTGIDAWTLKYMRRYNKKVPNKAIVYSTYQAYLKGCPTVLANHLALAREEGFTLGAKLVRGAYIASDPRHLINDTKADTDAMYDGLAESLMRKQYGPVLKPAPGEAGKAFPAVNVVLACHNHESVHKAQALRTEQAEKGEEQVDMVYAQLQGMADEISCELVQAATAVQEAKKVVDLPQAYKYLVWGTTGECMKYLLRRAQENKDAVQRTREGRNAMVSEVARRVKSLFGVSG